MSKYVGTRQDSQGPSQNLKQSLRSSKQVWEGQRQDDAALLLLIQQGNQKAFRDLTGRYIQPIWRLASNILNDKTEAEDVVQDVFMQLWDSKLDWQENGAKFSTWLYRVTLNKCIDRKRKQSKQTLLDVEIPKLFEDERPNGHEHLVQKQKSEQVKQAISTLSEAQQRVLHLFYFEELSIQDIAQKLDTTIDSVKSCLKRARQALKPEMLNAF